MALVQGKRVPALDFDVRSLVRVASGFEHARSPPTLADLLEIPGARPGTFARGLTTLDPERGCFTAPPREPGEPLASGQRAFTSKHWPISAGDHTTVFQVPWSGGWNGEMPRDKTRLMIADNRFVGLSRRKAGKQE